MKIKTLIDPKRIGGSFNPEKQTIFTFAELTSKDHKPVGTRSKIKLKMISVKIKLLDFLF